MPQLPPPITLFAAGTASAPATQPVFGGRKDTEDNPEVSVLSGYQVTGVDELP
jgi:hypothetical protein